MGRPAAGGAARARSAAGGNDGATGAVMAGMEEKGIPPFVLAFAVMIALLLLPALLGG